jgi:hypothetical protein
MGARYRGKHTLNYEYTYRDAYLINRLCQTIANYARLSQVVLNDRRLF